MHVLLEKPMVVEREDLFTILKAAGIARDKGGSLTVCHVLRYSPFFRKIKEIIDSGVLGEVQSIYHAENISYYYYVHSYVRGNWRNSAESSPLIFAKSSHDLDLLQWFAGSRPVWISSTSSRSIFTGSNAPAGVPERCSDGCPAADSCLYEAEKTYLYGIPLKNALSREGIWKALETGPYGRCVYRCDNDQAEHQETVIKFESGVTASFRLHGLSVEEGRTLRIFIGHSEADEGLMNSWSRGFTGRNPASSAI